MYVFARPVQQANAFILHLLNALRSSISKYLDAPNDVTKP